MSEIISKVIEFQRNEMRLYGQYLFQSQEFYNMFMYEKKVIHTYQPVDPRNGMGR